MPEVLVHTYTPNLDSHPTLQTLEMLGLQRPDINYGFSSTRFGNMSFRYSPREDVLANRRAFLATLEIELEDLVAMSPVHGKNIQVVDKTNCGNGALDFESAVPKTDGLITEDRTVALAVNPADCAPILFTHLDPKVPVKALVHSGKVGADLNINQTIVEELRGGFSIKPDKLLVGIGPTILCYPEYPLVTPNPDLWLAFAYYQDFEKADLLVEPMEDRPLYRVKRKSQTESRNLYFNLAEVNVAQLVAAGIPRENIDVSKICTYCNALRGKTYSDIARYQGLQPTARFMAVIQ